MLIVVLICISMMINDIEHLFHMFIGHSYVLFGEVSILILCPFLARLFVLLVLSSISSLYILEI